MEWKRRYGPRLGIERARDAVVRVIRDSIVDGRLSSGRRLHVTNISGSLAVSPATVRAAFLVLAAEGLIDCPPGRSARVSSFDGDAVTASIALGVLMRGVVSQTVPTLAGSALREVIRLVSRSRSLITHPGMDDPRAVAIDGYLGWASLSENAVLGELLASRSTALALASVQSRVPVTLDRLDRAHVVLRGAAERGDPISARRAIEALHGL
jgi:DNA-binding GntR family transcriptional regulator